MTTASTRPAKGRVVLEASQVAPEALDRMTSFHADVIADVQRAIEGSTVVVVGQNPHVRKVRTALDEAGLAFGYVEYGSYFSKWRERLAIKMWTGWPTFPQVFVSGKLIGGTDLTLEALQNGSLRRMIEGGA